MNETRNGQSKSTSALFSLMLVLSTVLVGMTPTVQAVGPNQNDLNSGGDLPDNTSVNITNYIFTGSFSGSGELDYGDDEDYLRVALNANEGLSATLSFPSTTTFANGTTVTNDFDLIFYDSNLTMMGSSWATNPETSRPIRAPSLTVVWCTSVFTATKALEHGTSPSPSSPSEAPVVAVVAHRSPTARERGPLPLIFSNQTIPPAPPHRPRFSHFPAPDCPFTRQLIPITLKLTWLLVLPTTSTSHSTAPLATSTPDGTRRLEASSSSGTTGNLESMQVTAFVNQTTYVDVYGWQGATNTYDIEITTDNPGGGQAFESVDVAITNTTHATLSFSGLTNGTTYNYNHTYGQIHLDGEEHWGPSDQRFLHSERHHPQHQHHHDGDQQ